MHQLALKALFIIETIVIYSVFRQQEQILRELIYAAFNGHL